MEKYITRLAAVMLLLFSALYYSSAARAIEKGKLIKDLSAELRGTTDFSDSISILTDLYDLCQESERDSIGSIILHTALLSGNGPVGLDILRDFALRHTRSDSLLMTDMKAALRFPESIERSETIVYIRMMQNVNKVCYSSDEDREKFMRELLRNAYTGKQGNLYEDIIALHGICTYLGEYAPGELLVNYLGRLDALIAQLPQEAYMLKNNYYTLAATAYAANEEPLKSIENDRKLLESIAGLEKASREVGRKYRDYDMGRYMIYTRMLSNYQELDDDVVEEIFSTAMRYVEADSVLASINAMTMRPQIYYAMFRKDYRHALDLLKTFIDVPRNQAARTRLLRMMIEAADKTGDKETLLVASRKYNEELEEVIENRSKDKYRELQVMYDMSQLKTEHAREAVEMQHALTITAIVVAVVLLVLWVISFMLWRHSKRLAKKLAVTNENLQAESYNLRQSQTELVKARDAALLADRAKSDFIKNMSGEVAVPIHTINEYTNLIVDCSEAGIKPYLRHFADLVLLNTEQLTTIVNDVLNLAEIDSDSVTVNMKREPLRQLCYAAVDSVKHKVRPGVRLYVDDTEPDFPVYTDSRRLMQILVQLLTNAAKFTEKGEIKVSFQADNDVSMAYIYVTDTGSGVTPGNAERIFERFTKLDRTTQGIGIGLSIARHLAELLGGNVVLDTTYTDGGARFKVTIPLG